MTKNRTEEDWFLRGGERPETPGPDEIDEGNPHDTDPCDECDGRTRCDDCPHNPDLVEDDEAGDEDDDDETREFRVRIMASQPVETFVVVTATDEEDACDKVAGVLDSGEFDPEAQDWDPVGSVDDLEIDDTDVTEV